MNNSISKKILLSIFIIFFVVSIVLLFWVNADADDLRKEKIYVLVNQKVHAYILSENKILGF